MVHITMADMAELADKCPGCIRLENADSNCQPPHEAIEATRACRKPPGMVQSFQTGVGKRGVVYV